MISAWIWPATEPTEPPRTSRTFTPSTLIRHKIVIRRERSHSEGMGVVLKFPPRRQRPRAAAAAAVFGPWMELADLERERARFFALCAGGALMLQVGLSLLL